MFLLHFCQSNLTGWPLQAIAHDGIISWKQRAGASTSLLHTTHN